MSGKSVPISVRISAEEAEFLARLQIQGATTPSEKLRAVLEVARRRKEGPADYSGARAEANELLGPVFQELHRAELARGKYSALVGLIGDWLPDTLALLRARGLERQPLEQPGVLEDLEKGLADRLFRLVEAVLHLAVTRRCNCYDPDIASARMTAILELADIISRNRKSGTGPDPA
jgi:hypothetical protein